MSLFCAALGATGVLLCREEWYPYAIYMTLATVALMLVPDGATRRRGVVK